MNNLPTAARSDGAPSRRRGVFIAALLLFAVVLILAYFGVLRVGSAVAYCPFGRVRATRWTSQRWTSPKSHEEYLRGSLDRMIAYKRFTGEYQSPVTDILLHLTLDGAYQRGQMATYVSSTGTTPINTDFVQWCLLHGV
jgi:hypothetical protein